MLYFALSPLLMACCLTTAWGQGDGGDGGCGLSVTCHFRDPRSEYKGQPGWNPEGTYDGKSPYAVDPTKCKNGTCYVQHNPCLYGFKSKDCPNRAWEKDDWGEGCHHDILCQCVTQEVQREKNKVAKETTIATGWLFFALMITLPLIGYTFIIARRRQLFRHMCTEKANHIQQQDVKSERTPASSSSATASSPTSQVQMVEVKSGEEPEIDTNLNGVSTQPVAQDDSSFESFRKSFCCCFFIDEKGLRVWCMVFPCMISSVLAILFLGIGYAYSLDQFWYGCNPSGDPYSTSSLMPDKHTQFDKLSLRN